MAVKHGVFVYENDTALSVPLTAENSVQVIIGTAPVWMLDDPDAVTNVPILCTSATEAMEKLGYVEDFEHYTLCQAMYVNANLFPVSPIVYINVLSVSESEKADGEMTLSPSSFGGTIPNRITAITNKSVVKSSIQLKQTIESETKTYTQANGDFAVEYTKEGTPIINLINSSISRTTNLVLSWAGMSVSAPTAADIIGSYDASTGKAKGAELINYVYPKCGVIPSIILAPVLSDTKAVGAALMAKAESINGIFKGMAVLDVGSGTAHYTVTTAAQRKASNGFTSPYCYPVWLYYKVNDKVIAGSVVAAAAMAYYDARNGGVPYRTPSNKLLGVSGTCHPDGTDVLLTRDQATAVNNAGIATGLNLGGWRLWGSYTGAYPDTTDIKDMWLPVRRMFNWHSNTFILTYLDKVDDPLNHVLVESVVDSENIRCAAYAPEQWAGAEIEYLPSDNSMEDLLAGKIVFRQKIAPYTPAQEIDNILSYDTSLIANALEGLV